MADDTVDGGEEISLRDSLVDAFEAQKEKEAPAQAPEGEQQVEQAEAKAASDKARDAKGKFARKEAPAKVAAAPEGEPAAPAGDPTGEAPPAGGKPAAVVAPQGWTAAAKAKWAQIPPEVQQEVARREDEAHRSLTRQDEERNFGRQVRDVVAPYMPMIMAEGGNPAHAIRDLLNTAYILRTANPQKKGQLLREVAQQFGADLSQAASPEYIDPTVQALQNEVAQLRGYLGSQDTQRKQQEQATLDEHIATFAADPKAVHFETVKADMASLLYFGRAKDLQEAYDMAIWARPDIRSTLVQQQQADSEAKRIADAKAKADAAKRASGSLNGAPGLVAPAIAPDRSLRDEIAANFRAAKAG